LNWGSAAKVVETQRAQRAQREEENERFDTNFIA
jgi:hypothetical protein